MTQGRIKKNEKGFNRNEWRVDSSVSALLLKEKGYEVIGATMKLWESDDECVEGGCCNLNSTMDAKRVCDVLNIPHYVLNFKEEFNKCVIQDFISEYKNAELQTHV